MAVSTGPGGSDRPASESEAESAVGYRVEGGVAVVELHRPSLDAAVKRELLAAVRRAGGDAAARAVLLTARGRAFCVGQDLKEHARVLREGGAEAAFATVREDYNPLVEAVAALEQPVVAAVEGACVGAGLGLALRADLRVAAEGARFATAFTGIGLASDSGLSQALARLLGPSRAAGLLLLGDRFGAAEAERWGLVHRVVPDGSAAAEGLALARRLADGPVLAFREVKALLRDVDGADLPEALEREAAAQVRLGATRDHAAAVSAFLAREQPRFEGR